MSPIRVSEWRKLPLNLTDLCIETALRCGQSFRWRKIDDEWNCVLYGRLLSLKQDKSHLHYRVISPTIIPPVLTPPLSTEEGSEPNSEDDTEALIRHYFSLKHDCKRSPDHLQEHTVQVMNKLYTHEELQLDPILKGIPHQLLIHIIHIVTALYDQWSKSDPNFEKKAPKFAGIRILSQDPWEALIAFICSSNNNISRISQMVHKLCKHYGPLIGHIGDEAFHDFPTPHALSGKKVEVHLRELGFGYRAKFIAETARIVSEEKPEGWLESLINPENPGWNTTKPAGAAELPTYRHAHEQLLLLPGVGPKVADCVCLMGLGWGEAVPVDTHVWQIAQRDYKFGKVKTKTFSKVMYDSVGDHFRKIWGQQAGWAQSVLFTANLKSFSEQASGKGKTEVVDVKVEVEEVKLDVAAEEPPSHSRKRRQVAVTETVKVEKHSPTRTTRASKRIKTRS